MKLQEHQLIIQVENPVDFKSLMFHGCDIENFYATQGWKPYFKMLNGPTYKALVRHFWVRASIFDRNVAAEEERELALLYPELAGKSRKEMLLEPFTGTEIRSCVMGVPVKINEQIIASALGIKAEGIYSGIEIPNPHTSTWRDTVNITMFNKKKGGKYSDLDIEKKILLKIQYENILPKGGGGDQPSLAHKVVFHHIYNDITLNLPRYIFKHMVKELWKSQNEDRVWVSYGSVLLEIFHQGGIIEALSQTRFYTDQMLDTVVGKVINGQTLKSMNLVQRFTPLKSDLSESTVVSDLLANFPPICKKDTLAVHMALLTDHFLTTGERISLDEVPEDMPGGKLPVERGRKTKRKVLTQEEYLEGENPSKKAKEESVKKAKVEAKVVKIPVPPTPFSPLSTDSDSDSDDIPLSQKFKARLQHKSKPINPAPFDVYKTIGELSEHRIGICNRFPANHPLQPPIIKPIQMILPDKPIPSSSQKPKSPIVVDSTAAAEEQVATEEPTTTEQPPTNNQQQTTSTPLNQTTDQQVLSNLESHCSGELPEFQHATENPPTQTQQKTIPESVIETVAEESIQVIES